MTDLETDLSEVIATNYGKYISKQEYVYLISDKDNKILAGIKSDGEPFFGVGCPKQIKDYIDLKVDKVEGKSLINTDVADSTDYQQIPGWLCINADKNGKILEGITTKGIKKIFIPTEIEGIDIKELGTRVEVVEEKIDQLVPLDIEVIVPSTINAIVGDTLQLFYHSIFKCVNFEHYEIKVECAVGNAYPRYYELTPSKAGTYTINFKIIDDNGVTVGHKASTLVVSEASQPSTTKNILILGASVEEGGEWASELKRRITDNEGDFLSLGYDNINFVGRKSVTYSGTHVNLEATGGYTYGSYVSTTSMLYKFYITTSPITQVNVGDIYINNKGTFEVTEINLTDGVGNISCKAIGSISGTVWGDGTLTRQSGTGDETITYSSSNATGNPFVYNGVINMQQYADDFCNPQQAAHGIIDIVVFGEMFVNGISGAREKIIELA